VRPRRISDVKSIAYETDIVEPPLASGRLTLNAEVSDDKTSRLRNSTGWSNVACRP
jgi:hypothetical protein